MDSNLFISFSHKDKSYRDELRVERGDFFRQA